MSLRHRPHVGWEIVCDAISCRETTATAGVRGSTRSPETAREVAVGIGWITTTIDGRLYWICPLQQTYDQRLQRWIAQPHVAA